MEEFEVINEIISTAVKDSSYVTVLISSSVFILYTLIVKIVEVIKSKDKNKPLLEMANAIKQNSENLLKLNQVLTKTIQDAEIKETNRIANVINVAFNSLKSAIFSYVTNTIIYNNIEQNKDSIQQNLYKIVSTEYYKIYSIFSAYEHDNVNVATKIKEEWIDEITKECIKIIYNGDSNLNRIRQIDTKLDLITEEYSTYINNKVFNH